MDMELAKLTSKGQLTLPATIRKKLRLEEGSKVVFLVDGGDVRIANAAMWLNEQNVAGKGEVENAGGKDQPEIQVKSKRVSTPGQKR